jgi:hypothetical protein
VAPLIKAVVVGARVAPEMKGALELDDGARVAPEMKACVLVLLGARVAPEIHGWVVVEAVVVVMLELEVLVDELAVKVEVEVLVDELETEVEVGLPLLDEDEVEVGLTLLDEELGLTVLVLMVVGLELVEDAGLLVG